MSHLAVKGTSRRVETLLSGGCLQWCNHCSVLGQHTHASSGMCIPAADLKPYGSCRPPHVENVCDFQHWEVVMGKSRVRTTIFVEQKTKPNTAVSHEGVFFCRHRLVRNMSPRT